MLRTGPFHSWRGGLGPVGSQRSGRDPSSGGPPALRGQGVAEGGAGDVREGRNVMSVGPGWQRGCTGVAVGAARRGGA